MCTTGSFKFNISVKIQHFNVKCILLNYYNDSLSVFMYALDLCVYVSVCVCELGT